MLDLRLIRDQPDQVKAAIATLNTVAPIDEILALDERRRALVTDNEALKAQLNQGSNAVRRTKDADERAALVAQMRALGDRIAALDAETKEADDELRGLLLLVPNLPTPDVPIGPDESGNVVVAEHGQLREWAFPPKPHWELGAALGILDLDRGIKVGGARNYVLRGDGARLQRALMTWMIDLQTRRHGYSEVYPPYLVPSEMLVGTGNLPKFGDFLYRDIEEDKWLIPTAEVPITNLYRDEILDEALLPIYHVAGTTCFRREKVSAGRDVRGIKRVFQFEKVEMVKFVHPETSGEEHRRLIGEAEAVLRGLGLPYRLLQICTGDLSFTAANKVDLETWAAGSNEWLEVSSCSNFRDFQARRATIRFRPEGGGRPQFVHTLNGSGLGLPRTLISIIEHYQREDGTIEVPEVLRPYLGGQEVIGVQPPIGPARSAPTLTQPEAAPVVIAP